MENIFKNKALFKTASFCIVLLSLITITSCTDVSDPMPVASGPPEIINVSKAENDSLTTVGIRENMYIIRGVNLATTTRIYFNEYETYFNPTLVRDDNIIVTIPKDAPWFEVPNTLKVVTLGGEDVYGFSISQPKPELDSFNAETVDGRVIVTINGDLFQNLTAVRFGDVDAEIISATESQIQVYLPDGISQAYIFVETPGGIVQSEAAYGFKYTIYGEGLSEEFDVTNGFDYWGWNNANDWMNTEVVKSGDFSHKATFGGNWEGIQYGGGSLDLSEYEVINVSIYGGENSAKVNLVLNGGWDSAYALDLVEGAWTNFVIPLSAFGSPASLTEIVFQESSGNGLSPIVIYIDDFGFN
ncbi:hypothetical protein L1I30_05815 [Gillisia sp. M10.2A]|uniref:IPT/TIG domain-containing protein n=1 Tax=Gillisia lutea TaxID=2909668 RepID=A0ABS9EEF3_9FLAO|nr:IPT/TIG domain-containing protein [Gillisia lutea]MCF4101173.1 hypothetical protein [Gillisia lutea]